MQSFSLMRMFMIGLLSELLLFLLGDILKFNLSDPISDIIEQEEIRVIWRKRFSPDFRESNGFLLFIQSEQQIFFKFMSSFLPEENTFHPLHGLQTIGILQRTHEFLLLWSSLPRLQVKKGSLFLIPFVPELIRFGNRLGGYRGQKIECLTVAIEEDPAQ